SIVATVSTSDICWLIHSTSLIMLFLPVRSHAIRIPGLQDLSVVLPRKVQEVPGILQGGIGWQGTIPARAAKMGSIAVDKAISKIGTAGEFYEHLDPEQISEHILNSITPEIWQMVDDVMWDEHPALWRDLPTPAKQGVIAPVQARVPHLRR